ncbi:hypothetical protein Tco_0546703 [Tanacetum coccineum]
MQKNQLALIKPKLNATIATRQGILLESVESREIKIIGGGMHGTLEQRMGAELERRGTLKHFDGLQQFRIRDREIKAYTQGLKKVEAQLVTHQQGQLWYEQKIKFMKIDLDDKTDVLTYHKKLLAEAQKEKEDLKAKFGLGYGDHRYDGILSYENEVLQSVFMNKESKLEKQPLYDSPKQTQPSESESQTSEFDTCESNISTEPSELVSEPVVNESNIECQPKVWSDAPIIEEYELDSEDEYVSIPTKEQETPSFANQQVKTPRETVKNQLTHSKKPKADKKELGQAELNKGLNWISNQREIRPIWNNVQRVNRQNQFIPTAVLTRTGKISVNTAKVSGTKNVSTTMHSFNRQTVLTSTAMKVNTIKPIVNRVRPANVFHKTHSPSSRPFKKTTVLRTNFSKQKVNTAKAHGLGKRPTLLNFKIFNGGLLAFGGSKGCDCFCWVKRIKREDSNVRIHNKMVLLERKKREHLLRVLVTKPHNKTPYELLTGTEDIIKAGDSEQEDESAQDCFVLPIWPSYSSTITPDLKTDEKRDGPREEEQVFMDELERLKRQEKEANKEAEALRKKFEHLVIKEGAARPSSTNIFSTVSTPAKASSTNLVNTVSLPVSTASLHEGLSLSDPTNPEEDDSEIPPLEDIYQNSTDGIFTTSSYDDEEPKKISEALEDESWVDAMQEELLQFKIQKVWVLVDLPYGKKAIVHVRCIEIRRMKVELLYRNKARGLMLRDIEEEGMTMMRFVLVLVSGHSQCLTSKLLSREFFMYLKGKSKLGDSFHLAMQKQTIVATSIFRKPVCCCCKLLWNPVYHSKTKHIAIRHHFIRDAYEKKLIQVLKIHTDDNVADLLTKAFDVSRGLIAFRGSLRRVTDGTEALLILPLFILWLNKRLLRQCKVCSAGQRLLRYETLKKNTSNKQLANVSVPLDHFPVNTLTSKVFSFMVKKGKHFSGKVTPLFATMLVQPTQDEGAPSERPSEAQPTPSPAPTSEVPNEPQTDSSPAQTSEVPIEQQTDLSPRPSPTPIIPDSIPETSGENLGGHSSSDKSLSGNEGDMTLQSVYDLCLSLCAQVSDQAKEIQHLKAQITKLKKQAKPVIKHHRAWLKSVSLKQRFPRKNFSKKHRVHKESVSKQGRKFAKGESSVQRDPLFDEIPEDTVDHMETENAQDEGRTREMVDEDKEIDENILSTEDVLSTDKEGVSTDMEKVSTDRPIVSTDMEKVSTDRPIVSTDGSKVSTDRQKEGTDEHIEGTEEQKEGTEEHNEGTEEQFESTDGQRKGTEDHTEEEIAAQTTQTPTQTPTSTMFGDDETIAKVLLNMSQAKAVSREKEKGVELKDIEEADKPRPTSTRSLLTLKPLPKIDPKDKGKKKIEEEDESESESDGIPQAEKKFKQLESDEELARKIQEEWEGEEERNRIAKEKAANEALIRNFDDIKPKNLNKFQDEIPEGFDRVLLGDLMVMFNPDDKNEFWNAQINHSIAGRKEVSLRRKACMIALLKIEVRC